MAGKPWTQAQKDRQSARLIGNSYRLGIKMTPAELAAHRAALRGNQNRRGIPHAPGIRAQIAASMRRAIAEGRHPSAGISLQRFRADVAAGRAPNPWLKAERNDRWVGQRLTGWSYSKIALREGLSASSVRKTVEAHIKRKAKQSCSS